MARTGKPIGRPKKENKFVRTSVFFTAENFQLLKEISKKENKKMAEKIRELIDPVCQKIKSDLNKSNLVSFESNDWK